MNGAGKDGCASRAPSGFDFAENSSDATNYSGNAEYMSQRETYEHLFPSFLSFFLSRTATTS